MIKAITIENFKGISEPVTIDFKPITLLFGANSVGKSTVFHALYYLHDILTQVGNKGDKVIYYDYGDFVSMVHNNNPTKDICITLNGKIAAQEDHFNVFRGAMFFDLWSANQETARLIQHTDEHQYSHRQFKLKISIGMIPEYDSERPVLKRIELNFMKSSVYIDFKKNKINIKNIEKLLILFAFDMEGLCGCDECDHLLNQLVDELQEPLNKFEDTLFELSGIHEIRSINRDKLNSVEVSYMEPYPNGNELYNDTFLAYKQNPMQLHQQPFLLKFINILIFGVFENIVQDLKETLYINPLRDMPRRDLKYIIADEGSIQYVNNWLGPQKFDTGLYFDDEKQYAVSLTNQEFSEINKIRKVDLIQKIHVISQEPVLKHIISNQKVGLSDVGFGISQLLPIIEAYTTSTKRFSYIFVEQPELHLHPRMQTVLADLIISWCHEMAQSPKTWMSDTEHKSMIETHSEHLLLRLLRRIRETTAGELPEGCDPVTPDQVAIHYFERKDGVVRVRELEVTPDGDSLGEWPTGFFEERIKELF